MAMETHRNGIDGVLCLSRCALNGETPSKETVAGLDLDAVYQAAQWHSVTAIVAVALEDAQVHDERFRKAYAAAMRKTMVLDAERKAVFQKLDEAQIWYMPLKGAVLKDWYPRFGMREMADCDILFDAAGESRVRQIMTELGFTVESYGKEHHDVYYKQPLCNFQMHVSLFGTGFEQRLNDYYRDVASRLQRGAGCSRSFTPEDFYIYMLAHAHMHFTKGGIGLRALMDTYVFWKRFGQTLDMAYVRAETEKLGIDAFEAQNRSLALHLFGGQPLTGEEEQMLAYMISSGTHGTLENSVKNRVSRYGGGWAGKLRYLRARLFVPLDTVRVNYPFFYRHRIFLPFLPLYRLVRSIGRKKSRICTELKLLKK